MKNETVEDAIKKCMPCEVCGNNNASDFRLRGTIRNGTQSLMIKCDVCDEVYPVTREGYKS